MKLLIACDMEGITGVTRWQHCEPTHPEYQRFRKLMTRDVNAAIRGACDAGADEISVSDGHDNGQNLLIEELDPRVTLSAGTFSPWSMMNGIRQGIDGVMFVGYHAKAGMADAILAHTWALNVLDWKINGVSTGEFGLNAMIAGYYGAAPILVSGDQALAAEAAALAPGIECAIIKEATGYFSGYCLPPERTAELIYAHAKQAVEKLAAGNAPKPIPAPRALTVELTFTMPHMAEAAARMPGAERVDGRSVRAHCPDVPAAFAAARAFCNLASG